MASRYQCPCGTIVYTNLFSGNGVYLLIPDDHIDTDDEATDASLIERVIQNSSTVAICPQCHRLAIIDKDYRITFYTHEAS